MTLYVLTYFWRSPQHSDAISLGVFDNPKLAQRAMMECFADRVIELGDGAFYSAAEGFDACIERGEHGAYYDYWFIQEVTLNHLVREENS